VSRRGLTALVVMALGAARPSAGEVVSVRFVVQVPDSTPAGAAVWLAGDAEALGGWAPAGVRLEALGGGRHTGVVALERGRTIEFKVTRGSWETVEKGPAGEELANRRLTASDDDTVRVTVAAWRDQTEKAAPRAPTFTGDVRRHPRLHSRFVRDRDVLVWLPPGYDAEPRRRYPVVYFHDGNNVLDAATSFIGVEWGADEAADRLVRAGRVPPLIVVAVYNTPDRVAEYTWVPEPGHGGGRAAAYLRYLVDELKPSVDSTWRTLPGAEHTAVIGSSLGGIVSLWMALERPDVFSRVGCVSPAAWWGGSDLARRVAAAERLPARLWMDVGTAEGTVGADERRWLTDARALRDAVAGHRRAARTAFHYEEVEGARHDERAWAARLDRVLEFLLADPPRR
jgi:predicted alpha/beta superfamily hydrolase